MHDAKKTLPFNQLDAEPPITGRMRVSADAQQTLALLSGFDGVERRLIEISKQGILITADVRPKDVINVTGVGADDDWQGDNIKCSEVKVMAHPDNASRLWVNIDEGGAEDEGEPLDAGDWLRWGLENLKNLHVHIVGAGDKVIITYG